MRRYTNINKISIEHDSAVKCFEDRALQKVPMSGIFLSCEFWTESREECGPNVIVTERLQPLFCNSRELCESLSLHAAE